MDYTNEDQFHYVDSTSSNSKTHHKMFIYHQQQSYYHHVNHSVRIHEGYIEQDKNNDMNQSHDDSFQPTSTSSSSSKSGTFIFEAAILTPNNVLVRWMDFYNSTCMA